MRSILVGVVALVVGAGGPAYGGGVADDSDLRPRAAIEVEAADAPSVREHAVVHERAPFREVVVEEYHSAGAEWGMGVASTILSIFYTPVRLTVGVAGAAIGGVEGFLTGGDLRTARSMWRPTVEGDYYIRPDHLDRTERYEFGNVRPVVRERYTLHRGRQAVLHEEETVAVVPAEVVVADEPESIPAEPELEDASDDR
jgi:hypothetical protein